MSALRGGLNRSTQHFILREEMECIMDQRYHRGFTAAEKAELWDRWQRGESLKAIGRAFGKPSSSIYFQVAPHGGIRRNRILIASEALPQARRVEVNAETICIDILPTALAQHRRSAFKAHRLRERQRRCGNNEDKRDWSGLDHGFI